MDKKYITPSLRTKELSMHCMLESSTIEMGGETDHFDAKEIGIFDNLVIEEDIPEEDYE